MARAGIIRVDTSDAILTKTLGVLRDKFHWEPYHLHFTRLELVRLANVVRPTETLNVAGDPDDNRILECAIAAASDYIVSSDGDLMRIGVHRGIRILPVKAFLEATRRT